MNNVSLCRVWSLADTMMHLLTMWNAKKSATKNVYYSTLKFYTYKTLTIVLVVHIWYTPMNWVIEEREMRPFIVKHGLLYAWF